MLVVDLLFILHLVLNNSRSFLWFHAARKEDEVFTPIKVLSYLSISSTYSRNSPIYVF